MATQHCSQCGAALIPQAKFCRACGTKIQASTPLRIQNQGALHRAPQRRWVLIALLSGGMFLILAAFFFLPGRSNPAATALPDEHDEAGIPYPDVPRLPVTDAKGRFDAGTATFVDVRSQEDYAQAHIPNALSLPLAELETRYQELPLQAEILTYCT